MSRFGFRQKKKLEEAKKKGTAIRQMPVNQ
jgi:hypothetical protein